MNRLIVSFLLFAIFFITDLSAQVFNTAHTLRNGKFSLGINPALLNLPRDDDAGIFLPGGRSTR